MADIINQGSHGAVRILQAKKTVDWMTQHTSVNVFNPLTFEGYQRSIDDKHCDNIVKYLKKGFYLPTPVICASREEYSDNCNLFIVDGQHRVEALKRIKSTDPVRYAEIKDYELPIIVLEKAEMEVEIDTFITINKTSKKVDTSLAYVLKNRINYNRASIDLSISKREYLAVELAVKLNESSGPWSNKILFEGQPKQTPQLISLNAFVVSMRSFLFYLQQYGIIPQNWENYCELAECIGILQESMNVIWQAVQNQWPDLFCSDSEKRRIIQGSIGFSSINKYLIQQLKSKSGPIGITEFLLNAIAWIQSIRLPSAVWLPGGRFSKLSSATGYSIIA